MVPEAKLKQYEGGLAPEGEGWFVVNARDARWFDHEVFGRFTRFEGEGDARFSEVGINVSLLEPGKASCMYHGENAQEDFLVLRGECLLLIEGEERPLKAWDFVHCPPWAEHVFVGAGSDACLILAVGTRKDPEEIIYRAAPVTEPYDAGVQETTPDPEEAYARFSRSVERPYREGDLRDG